MSGRDLLIAGYAALFDVADAGRDVIRKGAFRQTVEAWRRRGTAPPLLWQHRDARRIGTVQTLREDDHGLRVVAQVDGSSRAARLLRDGAVSGLSFGYYAQGWWPIDTGRLLERVELLEISLVLHPLQHRARVHWLQ